MYIFKKRLKAKNAFLKRVFSLFLIFYFPNYFAQTWEYSISKDFEFSIQDKWGESGLYEAKFVLYNQKTAFVKIIEVDDDNVGKLIFPDEFNNTRGKFKKDTITPFNWYIEVKKQKVAIGKIVYDPSPNALLQLFTYEFINFNNKELIWGDVVDGFQWVDKEGENIILRSVQMDVKNHISHLYIYHFLKTSDEFKLIRKLTDYVKKCDVNIFSSHNIESIELTDINKDTIGEISFSYTNDCSCIEDSLAISTKLMLITKGEKYAVRGLIDPKKKQPFIEYKVGASLKKNDLYRRFLIKKWKRISSEEKTIYN